MDSTYGSSVRLYSHQNTRMKKRTALLLLPTLLLSACQMRQSAEGSGPKPFFDLKGYMEEQIEELQARQPMAKKRILVDGQREAHRFDSLDYEKELRMFLRSDINRKAWFDKYQADSSFQAGQLKSVRYTTDAEDLKTRLMEVDYADETVERIYIENLTQSVVADVRQELLYQPGEGYRLFTAQQTALSTEQEVEVEVEWE